MFNWFKNVEKSLEEILGHFNEVHDNLNVFIDRTADIVDNLQEQITKHKEDLYQARSVIDNIKKILNKQ